MGKLEQIIKPTIGVLTNIGSAHDEGFANFDEKIKEKLGLFANAEVLIYKKDKVVDTFLNPNLKTFSWSFDDATADVLISQKSLSDKTVLEINNFEDKM
jgi:alanine racemase